MTFKPDGIPLDKGTISVINAALICITMMGLACIYEDLKNGQTQELALLNDHGGDIKTIKGDLQAMKARQVAVYWTRVDLNEMGIAFNQAEVLNPGWHAPNIYRIQRDNPPQPTPLTQ